MSVTTRLAIHAYAFTLPSATGTVTPVWSSMAWLLGPCKDDSQPDNREVDSPHQLNMFEVMT